MSRSLFSGSDIVEKRESRPADGRKHEQPFILVDEVLRRLSSDVKKYVKRTRLEELALLRSYRPHFQEPDAQPGAQCPLMKPATAFAESKPGSGVGGVSVIATAVCPRHQRRSRLKKTRKKSGPAHDPYALVFFLYCDYLNNFDTPFLEWEWEKKTVYDTYHEEYIAKTLSMGSTNARFFYRYFEGIPSLKNVATRKSKLTAMIENLERFKTADQPDATRHHGGHGMRNSNGEQKPPGIFEKGVDLQLRAC
jgi:hypothetical protein